MPLLKLACQLFIIKLIKDKIMTIAEDMKAALPQLQAQHGLTTDQVNDIVTKAVTPLQDTITGILSSEKSDQDKLADIESALGELTTAFAPAAQEPVADATPVEAAVDTHAAAEPDAAPATTESPSA